jgi:hypothetical protein
MKGFDRLKVSMAAALCSVAIGNPGYAADDPLAPPEPPKLQGYTVVRPMQDSSESAVSRAVAAGATIPNWRYSVTPRLDGQRYTGRIVGTNPFQRGAGTSTIPTQLIPLIIKIADANGTVTYDPTKADPACAGGVPATLAAQSPVFANHPFVFGSANVGNTQYVDAFQRANFWKQVSTISPNYHTRLALKTLKPITVTVPAAAAALISTSAVVARSGSSTSTGSMPLSKIH